MNDLQSRSKKLTDKIDALRRQTELPDVREPPSKRISSRDGHWPNRKLGLLTLPQHLAGVCIFIALVALVHFCVPA